MILMRDCRLVAMTLQSFWLSVQATQNAALRNLLLPRGQPVSIKVAVLCRRLDSGHPSGAALLNAVPRSVAY